ncbi:MAG: hypothetical protein PUH64_09935 [Prevotella sp.]|nr:hypothetical protein [Prevotella sp.]
MFRPPFDHQLTNNRPTTDHQNAFATRDKCCKIEDFHGKQRDYCVTARQVTDPSRRIVAWF